MNIEIDTFVKIENMIYEIRNKQVMLDSDLARLYQCKNGTKTINQAVGRHKDRFPEDFYFQITLDEYQNLKSQIGTSSYNSYGGIRKLPYVFTEEGVAMLATVLRTGIASQISIDIMRAFVAMRKYISNDLISHDYIKDTLLRHDNEIRLLQETFKKFEEKKKVNEIYFYGQIYDAYSKILDIVIIAKKELIVVDNYADKSLLDIFSRIKCQIILITRKSNDLLKIDLVKYNKQYRNLEVIYDHTFHDRYFILDRDDIYHCGTSINYAGSKTFSINLLEDKVVKDALINNIKKLIGSELWLNFY